MILKHPKIVTVVVTVFKNHSTSKKANAICIYENGYLAINSQSGNSLSNS